MNPTQFPQLPQSKTCADCRWIDRCRPMFGIMKESTECGFEVLRLEPRMEKDSTAKTIGQHIPKTDFYR